MSTESAHGESGAHGFDPAGRPDAGRDERPLTALLTDLAQETGDLVRKEVELARAELAEKATQATRGAVSLAVGGAVCFLGMIFLLLSATLALATVVEPWAAALIVGGAVLLIGGIMVLSGRSRLSADNLQPRRTVETLKEDGRWAKAQIGR